MPPLVRFHSHAGIALETERWILLTDPSFVSDVFNDSWSLHVPPDLDTIDFNRVRYIWISHEHPDHLHFPSLALIRKRVDGPVTVYYRRHENPAVRDALVGMGFDVVEMTPHEEIVMADGISGTLFPTDIDSALVIRTGDRIILNQNDCSLNEEETSLLKSMFPRIDAWFYQFSLGGYYANADDPGGLQAAREYHLKKVEHYFKAFRPEIFVPFASFFYFSKPGNDFLNKWAITPAELVDTLPDLPAQVLWGGDLLLWERWEERNAVNFARWTEVLRGPRTIKPHRPVPDGELIAAGRSFMQEAIARGTGLYGAVETHLEIMETGRAVEINFETGRFAIVDRPDPGRLAISAPAEELLYFLKSPHGHSIFYGSAYHLASRERWNALREVHGLVFGEGLPGSRLILLKWYVARLDRQFFGGTIRRSYSWIRSDRSIRRILNPRLLVAL